MLSAPLDALRGKHDAAHDATPPRRAWWSRLTSAEPERSLLRDWLLVLIVVVPVIFNAVMLLPEVTERVPSVNDDAFHYLMIQSASDAIAGGASPLDSWGPEMDLGAPRFLYYQNMPALFVIALDRITFGQFAILDLFNLTRYVLMVTLPFTVYWSARRLEFSAVAAAGCAAAVSLLSAGHLYGIEYDSYVWRGWGMFTQLWAVHLSFVTLACLWRLARTGRGAVAAILAASALVLSHLLYAEMMVISGALVFLAGTHWTMLRRRLLQFAGVGAAIAVITSYLWLSYLQQGAFVGESPYDAQWKLDSFGAATILDWLWRGEIFDHGRWPVFTALVALGAASLLLVRSRPRLLALALFLVWLVLYFGRSVWGPVADHVPQGSMLLFHRFIGSLDIAGVLLIGLGFELAWRVCTLLPRRAASVAAAAALCALLLTPALVERHGYYEDNTRWMRDVAASYEADRDARQIIETLRALPPGRTYAGLRSNWGNNMRFDQVQWYRALVFHGITVVSPPLPSINLNSDLMFHFNDQDRTMYDLFDVRYVVAPTALPLPDFLTPVLTTTRYTLYRTPTSGAAVFASSTVRRAAATKPALFEANRAWLLGQEPAARAFIRWDYPADSPSSMAVTPGCAQGTVSNEVLAASRIEVDASCDSTATLVFKSTYHPNWRVTVDGREQEAFMVSPSYIGVEVPAGTHRVVAEYRSPLSRTALAILGALTLAAVPFASRIQAAVRRRLRRAPAEPAAPAALEE